MYTAQRARVRKDRLIKREKLIDVKEIEVEG